eukprot:TCONS_00011069-protein
MATRSLFRLTCHGSNKYLIIRALNTTPRTLSREILPTITARKSITLNNEKALHTTALTSQATAKELFELPKNKKEGASHWMTERVVAVALLGAIPAAVFYPTPLVDHCLSVLLPLHAYWGVNAIIGDYLYRPLVPVTKLGWAVTCVLTGAGLIYLNIYDVGIVKFCQMVLNL